MNKKLLLAGILSLSLLGMKCVAQENPVCVSGIYPHLASYNKEGECGTGAVVPWAGRLWVITYGPHLPYGSSDKLYEISPQMKMTVRKESIGGTPANRMIHKESGQLFIGPYAINEKGDIRVIPYTTMRGRHTGNARHIADPEGKIYYGTMEEGIYEVDVNTLEVKTIYEDGNIPGAWMHPEGSKDPRFANLKGAHGKGLYSGQGVLVFSNNGENNHLSTKQFDIESGGLHEWNGNSWKLVRRNQFVEVTGPGGIYGNQTPYTDQIWATGWDHKSNLLGVREVGKGWSFYRLPKASNSYDGAHGWNTEWPRIRDVGTKESPQYLMTLHGMFWQFPATFRTENSRGIKPLSSYLKVIGDFTRWNDMLVMGCDDSAQKEFLNTRKEKGAIEGPGESNSNLWFVAPDKIGSFGTTDAAGAVWLKEKIDANTPSEPMLFEGWQSRAAWVKNSGEEQIEIVFELDIKGDNRWSVLKSHKLDAGASLYIPFDPSQEGVWIRAVINKPTTVSLSFVYKGDENRTLKSDKMFAGISQIGDRESNGGLLWSLGDDRRKLGVVANTINSKGVNEIGYYELDENLKLVKKEDPQTADRIRKKMAIPKQVVTVEKGSVLIVDQSKRRWRLPINRSFTEATNQGSMRICREVATERDLFNCGGTFYELPAENADGFAKIRPVASHNYKINDYASYRGLLVMTGVDPKAAKGNSHIITSQDKKTAVWVGGIDDLWKMGKPVGEGGPWVEESVKANIPSDPYLISHYNNRTLKLSCRGSQKSMKVTIEVDPIGNGDWVVYKQVNVENGKELAMNLERNLQARWIRFTADKDCKATAWLSYK